MKIDDRLRKKIESAKQEHLLKYLNDLPEAGQEKLISQLQDIDFDKIPELVDKYVINRPKTEIPDDLAPAKYYPAKAKNSEEEKLYLEAEKVGRQLISDGKVACLTVAGGQGTRLGFNRPKGTYPIGPISGRTLFAYFAGGILRNQKKYNCRISWYIMTSLLNNDVTVAFFRDNNYFGLDPEQVFFFSQGTMPAIGYDGRILMNAKDSLALSPDGHGGTLLALRKSGALAKMERDGVEYISYFQVDNPLVPVVDPKFIGLHKLTSSQMSAVMLAKTCSTEKLGNFCVSNGRLQIIEYSDLPQELAEKRLSDGTLAYIAGSPAIHVIDRKFVEQLTSGGELRLPWHRADKKIPFISDSGDLVAPTEPNGVKLESFIFDALPLAERTMVLECDRKEVFAPTKNPTGVDSVESCRAMLIDRDLRRMQSAGVSVPVNADGKWDCEVEIAPELAVDAEDVAQLAAARSIKSITPGSRIVID